MDAPDDADVGLQHSASNTIPWLVKSLPLLLYRSRSEDSSGSSVRLRPLVRRDVLRGIINSLSPFQELPQLLDPNLEELLRPLSVALIHASQADLFGPSTSRRNATSSSWAVCSLLYTFCRIRGAKVIVRFLSNEAKHLVPLVNALETRLWPSTPPVTPQVMSWEEKYIYLLWLSHLVLTPFPFPPNNEARESVPSVATQLRLPENLGFVSRICTLALAHLASPSKERDSAVEVLVHLVMRPDMRDPGLMTQLLDTAQRNLNSRLAQSQSDTSSAIGHEGIGWLALLAGIFNAVDAQALASHLKNTVGYCLNVMASAEESTSVASSAVARKLIVKVMRCSALAALSMSSSPQATSESMESADEILEEVIEQLLNSLRDADTPVRHAASKALSLITLKLDPATGTEITEAVIGSLDEGVLWTQSSELTQMATPGSLSKNRDLSLVNPLRWQGLILTLAQLLFRKAPAPEVLSSLVSSLILGLSFEQTTSTGLSVGGPVRDAANFGIWSLSRQYTSNELLHIEPSSVQSLAGSVSDLSLIQILACELVNAACLDPSGNIRRGASAALQELIGRHPDTIKQGIAIVQTVDYHAIALRSAAIVKVSVAAGQLDDTYRTTLLAALLGWRGISSIDADSRRWAAKAIGQLASHDDTHATQILRVLYNRVCNLQPRQVEERHGLLLSVEQVIRTLSRTRLISEDATTTSALKLAVQDIWKLFAGTNQIESKCFTNPSLRPFLTCEAVFCLLTCLCEVAIHEVSLVSVPSHTERQRCIQLIGLCISIREPASLAELAKAARAIFAPGIMQDSENTSTMLNWIQKGFATKKAGPSQEAATIGWLTVLSRLVTRLSASEQNLASQMVEFVLYLTGKDVLVNVRVAAFENLDSLLCEANDASTQQSIAALLLGQRVGDDGLKLPMILGISEAILRGLADFTTDQRGDVGSLVRVAALRCASHVAPSWLQQETAKCWSILAAACGLAVEKLDRVRAAAWPCVVALSRNLPGVAAHSNQCAAEDSSSTIYFFNMLNLAALHPDELLVSTLTGLVGATGTGSESVLHASREGLQLLLVNDEYQLLVLKALASVLINNMSDERFAPQALITIAFAFETGTLARYETLSEAADVIRNLFAQVQKAHYKSTSIPRLLAAVDIYASLSSFSCVRTSILKKLSSMLGHQFPVVRRKAAESLYCITNVDGLLRLDWSKSLAQLKSETQAIREIILPT